MSTQIIDLAPDEDYEIVSDPSPFTTFTSGLQSTGRPILLGRINYDEGEGEVGEGENVGDDGDGDDGGGENLSSTSLTPTLPIEKPVLPVMETRPPIVENVPPSHAIMLQPTVSTPINLQQLPPKKVCFVETTETCSDLLREELSASLEEEEEDDKNYKEGYRSILKNPIGYPLIILIIGVIIVIVINIILIYRAPSVDQNGVPINNDVKWTASVMVAGVSIVMAVIFAGLLHYGRGLTLCDYQWLVIFLTLVYLFLIALFTAYLAGWWLNVGFLWSPKKPKPAPK